MSDTPNIQQIVQDQLDILPDSVREAVDSQEWRRKIYDIGRKYSLKIDQLGALEQSTYYTMIGLIPSSQYISELVNQVGVGRDVASSLAKEIDDGVFEDIRSFIMQMDGVDEDTAELLNESLGESTDLPSGAIPSREDLLSEIEAIGEPSSSPAPVVTFSPVETQLSKATASRPVDLNPAPAVAPTPAAPISTTQVPAPAPMAAAPVAPVLPVAPKPAPVVIPIISLTDTADDAGLEFTESPQGLDKEETPTDMQVEAASIEDSALDLDSAPTDLSAVAMPEPVAAQPVAVYEPAPAPISTPTPVTEVPAAPAIPSAPINPVPGIPQAITTPDGKISPVPLTNDPYQEQF
jgi:hypothetical protein